MRGAVGCLVLLGCGRIAFDPLAPCGPIDVADRPFASSHRGADGITEPFLICTREQLEAVALAPERWFVLGADLDLGAAPWTPLGDQTTPFTGTFDGDGHAIASLRIDLPAGNNVGLFGWVGEGGHLANVTMHDVDVVGGAAVGALAGYIEGDVIVEHVRIDGSVIGVTTVGGAIGYAYCESSAGSRVNTQNIVHDVDVTIDVVASGGEAGGVIGETYCGNASAGPQAEFSNLSAAGTVTASAVAGGLLGEALGFTLDQSSSSATVICGESGGLVGETGYGNTLIINSFATGSVTCTDAGPCAGLVAVLEGDVVRSYATGDVDCGTQGAVCGGLVGFSGNTIRESYATGNVRGLTEIAGLVAEPYFGTVEDSYATGTVTGDTVVGGLTAQAEDGVVVARCYSTSTVTGTNDVGGIAGVLTGQPVATAALINSFFAGAVTASSVSNDASPVVGHMLAGSSESGNAFAGTCTNTAGTCMTQGTAMPASAFYTPTSVPLTTWDFGGVWQTQPGGYPTLRNVRR